MTESATTPRFAFGDYLRVEPKAGYMGVEGFVIGQNDAGFDLMRPVYGQFEQPTVQVMWAGVAAYRHAQPPSPIVRVYRGSQQADVNRKFQEEAGRLGHVGYEPSTQSWAQGQWGCGAWLFALLACIVVVGLLVFLYMLIVKPEGTLTVTFVYRGLTAAGTAGATTAQSAAQPAAAVPQAPVPLPGPAPSEVPWPVEPVARRLSDRLAELAEARDAGHITDEEYTAKRASILDQH